MSSAISLSEDIKKVTQEKFAGTFDHLVKYYSKSDKYELEEIFSIWNEVFKSKVRVYSTLSAHFFYFKAYGMSEAGEDVQIFLRNLTLLKEIALEKQIEDVENFAAFIEKIKDHIDLIGIQINRMDSGVEQIETYKQELSSNIKQLQSELEITKKEYQVISNNIDTLEEKQEKSLKKAKKVQKEFVTILGIFATILITTFGGLTSLSSIFNNINNASTGKLMLMGTFVIFTVMIIIFLLLNGISKLSELNIRSCGCDLNQPCNCSIVKKHPTLYMMTVFLVLTALVGISEYVIDYKLILANIQDMHLMVGLLLVLLIISFISFIYFICAKKTN